MYVVCKSRLDMFYSHTYTHHLQAVELENSMPRAVTKYVVIITTNGYQGTEETVVLGTEQEGST